MMAASCVSSIRSIILFVALLVIHDALAIDISVSEVMETDGCAVRGPFDGDTYDVNYTISLTAYTTEVSESASVNVLFVSDGDNSSTSDCAISYSDITYDASVFGAGDGYSLDTTGVSLPDSFYVIVMRADDLNASVRVVLTLVLTETTILSYLGNWLYVIVVAVALLLFGIGILLGKCGLSGCSSKAKSAASTVKNKASGMTKL
jgi:hypothetical protein